MKEQNMSHSFSRIILFTAMILCCSLSLTGQVNDFPSAITYGNRTDAGVFFGIGKFNTDVVNGIQAHVRNDQIAFALRTINGIKIQQRAFLGVGLGAEFWQHALFFPVTGNLSYDFSPGDHSFFAALGMGYAFGNRKETTFYHSGKGGFTIDVGVGYKMKVAKKLQFAYEIFYKYQAIQTSYAIKDSVATENIDYKLGLNFLGFRLGIVY